MKIWKKVFLKNSKNYKNIAHTSLIFTLFHVDLPARRSREEAVLRQTTLAESPETGWDTRQAISSSVLTPSSSQYNNKSTTESATNVLTSCIHLPEILEEVLPSQTNSWHCSRQHSSWNKNSRYDNWSTRNLFGD